MEITYTEPGKLINGPENEHAKDAINRIWRMCLFRPI